MIKNRESKCERRPNKTVMPKMLVGGKETQEVGSAVRGKGRCCVGRKAVGTFGRKKTVWQPRPVKAKEGPHDKRVLDQMGNVN